MPDSFKCTLDRSQAIPTYDCKPVEISSTPTNQSVDANRSLPPEEEPPPRVAVQSLVKSATPGPVAMPPASVRSQERRAQRPSRRGLLSLRRWHAEAVARQSPAVRHSGVEAVTTVSSPRGLLMIGLSFWTGLFTAYVLCATGRINVTLEPFATLAAISPWSLSRPRVTAGPVFEASAACGNGSRTATPPAYLVSSVCVSRRQPVHGALR